uniref:RNA polymerase II transcription factor B subunit 3 n=1 Tax=Blastobotrys adeninivorans TaxID=409370 RepID=A0A060TDJ4_BLAAD
MDDVCPICKSSRYLNPNMRFLVNPECYHKMCESCVDRIFSLGPAPCPYAGCNKILRKNKFKEQVFEDVGVEREVNVRSRVAKVFNKREDDFDTLEEYNNYLEEVEDIVFNLVNEVDVQETEAKLQSYEQANRTAILANFQRQKQEDEALEELRRLDEEQKREERMHALQEEEEEAERKREIEAEIQRQLATGSGSAEEIIKRVNANFAHQAEEKKLQRAQAFAARRNAALKLAHGLRNKATGVDKLKAAAVASPMTPFTPFNGDRQRDYVFTVQEEYFDPLTDNLDQDPAYKVAGFSVQQAHRQAIVQAFAGLGCDIQREKSALVS